MPAQTGKSKFFDIVGPRGRAIFNELRGKEVEVPSAMRLPPGIDNGIAKLSRIEYGTVEKEGPHKGKTYWRAVGIVVEPKVTVDPRNGQQVQIFGAQTSVMGPLYATPERTGEKSRKTEKDHIDFFLNQLKLLGIDMTQVDPDDAVAILNKQQPHFRFRTWYQPKRKKGDPRYNPTYDSPEAPEPRVNEEWSKSCEYSDHATNGEDLGGFIDGGAAASSVPAVDAAMAEPDAGYEEANAEASAEAGVDGGETDWDALAAVADDAEAEGMQDAVNQINQAMLDAGFTAKQVEKYDSWTDAVEALKEKMGADEPEPAASESVEVGQVYKYQPLDPKTKKLGKAIDVEVSKVNVKARTADVFSLDDKKRKWAGVSFDRLS